MDGRLCLFGTSEARNRLFGVQSDAFVFGNCRRYGGLDAVCGLSCQTMEVGCRREVRLYDRRRYAGGDRYFPRRRCRRDSCRGVGSQRYDGSQDGLEFCSAGGCHLQSDGRDRIGAACFRTIAYFFETEGAVRSDKQSQINPWIYRPA